MNFPKEIVKALEEEGVTFAARQGDKIKVSKESGISPMIRSLLQSPEGLKGAFVADRVIGRAAAFLLVYGEVKGLHAKLISSHAKEVLLRYGLPFEYEEEVPYIKNRRQDGMCPMEQSVLNTENAEKAFEILCEKWKAMGN